MPRPDTTRLYRAANTAVLGLMLYGLALPFVLPALSGHLAPGTLTCPVLRWTGVACPMCGLTRAMRCLLTGSVGGAAAFSPLSLFVLVFAVGELAYRSWAVATRPTPPLLPRLIRSDILVHALLVIGYFAYTGAFFLLCR